MVEFRKHRPRAIAKTLNYHLAAYTAGLILLLVLVFASIAPLVKIVVGALIGLVFIQSVFVLVSHVCRPIKRVEDALDKLNAGEGGMPTSHDFDGLIELLKKSFDNEYTADILKKEAELNALQSQINPHFLYNVLDTIRGHAMAEGVPEIAEMTEALSHLFRYSISHWESEVTLDRELSNVRSYFKIQQYRFNNKFDLRIIIENDEDKILSCKLPKLTLQPIIENAIYHGLEMKIGRGLVTLRARQSDDLLLIEINDDGMGVDPTHLKEINRTFHDWRHIQKSETGDSPGGIALPNVNSRIKMMYGEEYGLHMYSTPGFGAMIEILLPSEKAQDQTSIVS